MKCSCVWTSKGTIRSVYSIKTLYVKSWQHFLPQKHDIALTILNFLRLHFAKLLFGTHCKRRLCEHWADFIRQFLKSLHLK